jgi:exopolyphosphatase/pppGpp-phosphohydrolase
MQSISAIDVGSNAIRMAVGQVNSPQDRVDVIEKIRIPAWLGQDVFTVGARTESTMQAAMDAFRRFRKIAGGYDLKKIRAVATSAMREAENGRLLITGTRLPRGQQARTSAMRLGQKYHFDAEHGIRVARTALSLLDQTLEAEQLEEDKRLVLRAPPCCMILDTSSARKIMTGIMIIFSRIPTDRPR